MSDLLQELKKQSVYHRSLFIACRDAHENRYLELAKVRIHEAEIRSGELVNVLIGLETKTVKFIGVAWGEWPQEIPVYQIKYLLESGKPSRKISHIWPKNPENLLKGGICIFKKIPPWATKENVQD